MGDVYVPPPTAPISVIVTCLSAVAVVTSYAFPEQRRFPTVMLAWSCVCDFFVGIYMCFRWVPGYMSTGIQNDAQNGNAICRTVILVETFFMYTSAMICFLLTFTLYASIVRGVKIASSTQHHTWYLVSIWVVSLVCALVTLFDALQGDPVDTS